ncbi:hypothetical protein Tco_1480439, partial [Tanacetum coccineum]
RPAVFLLCGEKAQSISAIDVAWSQSSSIKALDSSSQLMGLGLPRWILAAYGCGGEMGVMVFVGLLQVWRDFGDGE